MRVIEDKRGVSLFENTMVTHLRKQHPTRFGRSSTDELRALVRAIAERARSWGIDDFEGCAIFLELVTEFGESFPQGFAWAERALTASANITGARRAEVLLEAAARWLDEDEARHAAELDAQEIAPPALDAEEGEEAVEEEGGEDREGDVELEEDEI